MSKDCDIFSDTYGCVVPECEGYQSPFPIVRLGDCRLADDRAAGGYYFRGVAYLPGAPGSHKLLTLHFAPGIACRSLLEVLAPDTPPVDISKPTWADTRFISSIVGEAGTTAIVTRDGPAEWAADFLLSTKGQISRIVVPGIHALALADADRAWCLHGSQNHLALVRPSLLLHGTQQPPHSSPLENLAAPDGLGTGARGSIVATGKTTAVAFVPHRVVGIDSRQRSPSTSFELVLPADAHIFPAGSCGVAKGHVLLGCTAAGRLMVFDQRKVSQGSSSAARALVAEKQLEALVSVRARADSAAALLVSGDQVGVMDVRTQTVIGAFQQSSDGDVLDALAQPILSDTHIHATTTAVNGMLYNWRMRFPNGGL